MSASVSKPVRPQVFRTVGRAWRSAGSALVRMPLAFLLTVAALVAKNAVLRAVGNGVAVQAGGDVIQLTTRAVLAALLATVLQALLLAPLAIAVHRFVLLGERTQLLPLVPLGRVLRFAGWLVAIGAAVTLPGLFKLSPQPWAKLAFSVLQIAAVVMATRFALVFPAVAVQPDGKPDQLGWRETKWQFWRIFAVLFLIGLSITAVEALDLLWLTDFNFRPGAPLPASLDSPLQYGISAVIGALGTALAAAAASWLFVGYGMADGRA